GTLMRVESMYGVQVGNPYLLDDNRAAVIQCLYEEGHVEADYTVEECDRHLEDRMDSAPYDLGEVAHDTCRGGNTWPAPCGPRAWTAPVGSSRIPMAYRTVPR